MIPDRTTTIESTKDQPNPPIARRAAAGGAVALAANVVLWAGAKAFGASFVVRESSDATVSEVTLASIAFGTVVSLAVGTAVVAIAARLSPRAARLAIVAGAVLAVLSVGGPLSADTDGATSASLAAMHLATGAVFVAALSGARSFRGRSSSADGRVTMRVGS